MENDKKDDKFIKAGMGCVIAVQLAFLAYLMLWEPKKDPTFNEWAKNLKPIEVQKIEKGTVEEAVVKLYETRLEMAKAEHETDILDQKHSKARLNDIKELTTRGAGSAKMVSDAEIESRKADLNVKYSKLSVDEATQQLFLVRAYALEKKLNNTISVEFDIRQRRSR